MNNDDPLVYQPGQNGGGQKAAFGLGQMIGMLWAGIPAWLAAKAIANHYAYSGDAASAAWLGATAGRRWNTWITALIFTVICVYVCQQAVPVMAALLLVTYARCIDASLFKRGAVYRFVNLFHRFTDRLPNLVLYTALFVYPFALAWFVV